MGEAELLSSLHGSPAHKQQMKAWKADFKAFERLKDDWEDERRRVRGEAYQVATLYTMFQTVIFAAVSQPTLLTCALWWCPVSLSFAVSVAAFLAISDKLYSIGEVQEEIKETGFNMQVLDDCLNMAEQQGAGLDLETQHPKQEYQKDKLAGYRLIGSIHGISALLFLTGFSLLIGYFSTTTLCRINCSRCSPSS